MKARGLKATCLAVGLVTAWGSPANAQTDVVQLTLTPSNELTHVYFLYGPNSSGHIYNTAIVALPDVAGGATTTDTFDVTQNAPLYDTGYVVLGLYDESNLGVTISLYTPYTDSHIIGQTNFVGVFSFPENTLGTALLSNDTVAITAFVENHDDLVDIVGSSEELVNFSNAANGGSAFADMELIVPEPSSGVLVGFGALLLVAMRRRSRERLALEWKRNRDP